jgi:hypothetical protein
MIASTDCKRLQEAFAALSLVNRLLAKWSDNPD